MNKERFYIDTRGNDDEAYREAIQFACDLAAKDPDITKVMLLAISKHNVGWLERLFDRDVVKQLYNGMRFKGCNPIFKIETVRNLKKAYGEDRGQVIICLGLDDDDLFIADDYYPAKIIITIPWRQESVEKWLKTWNPTELRGKGPVANAFPKPSKIVQIAMKELTDSINMSTGISHPMDESMAKTTIRALRKYESELNADVVKAFLVSDLGWDAEDASDIHKLITTLNEGRHFQGGDRTGLQHNYKRWREESDKND